VKALRAKNYFPIRLIHPDHIYVFVVLNKPGEAVQYFIVPERRLVDEAARFMPKLSRNLRALGKSRRCRYPPDKQGNNRDEFVASVGLRFKDHF
jgi:hypothetical protein